MPNLFAPRADLMLRAGATAMICMGMVGAGAFLTHAQPDRVEDMGRVVAQPVMFSHQHHAGALGLECLYCHTSPARSDFAGMPTAQTCMNCHAQIYTDAPMLEPVRRAWTTGAPLVWNRVYDLPDVVTFSHRVHVRAGVDCASCHGDVAAQPLTTQQTPMTMGWCLDCHRHPQSFLALTKRIGPSPELWTTPSTPSPIVDRTELLTNCSACHR